MSPIKRWFAAALVLAGVAALAQTKALATGDLLVYFGTYTGQNSKGIYVSRLDLASGVLGAPQLAAETANPSFLAVHGSRPFLYAVNEVRAFGGKPGGAVSAFAIDRASGTLTHLNQQSSAGADPAHLVVDGAGRNVLVANYSSGNVAVLPIAEDGRLKPATAIVQHTGRSADPDRQREPHAHGIALDPANRFAYVADLGIDTVQIYGFNAAKGWLTSGEPESARVRAGSGPRHVTMDRRGTFAYVINEMACTITVFKVDSKRGGLQERQTVSTLPAGQAVNPRFSTAEIAVHPSGRFLYGSNRGHDTIAVFAIDGATGELTAVEHEPTQGSTPRGFGIDPTGAYLLVGNQRSDTVVVFRIDAATGRLTPSGQRITVGSPVSIEFVR